MKNLNLQIKSLPKQPGIYVFKNINGQVLYVGKSINIQKRVASYFQNKDLGPKTTKLVSHVVDIAHIKVFSEFEALLLEASLIKKYQPFYNSVAKDDKSPLYIKINAGDIPLISTTRAKVADKKDFLVGPFPSVKNARDILKIIRKIFPYCQHKKARKPCLYVHLGLCPYPYRNKTSQKEYQKTVRKIKKLLLGRSQILIKQLTWEMKISSLNQKYEQADVIKKQIEKLQHLFTTFRMPHEFLQSPSLVDDLKEARLNSLKDILNLENVPQRIECYDISNILGKYATGSMIVFEEGEAKKSQYRRFKIKFATNDDYQMIREVLTRRFKNDWPKPDLIVIDGGRGQLNVALKTLADFKLDCAAIALAKKREEIYMPGKKEPLSLPKDNEARLMLEALRNEAHRFAITYHKLLRSKSFLKL